MDLETPVLRRSKSETPQTRLHGKIPRSRTKKNPGLTWDRSVIPPLRGGDVTASVQKRVLLQVGAESQWICPGLDKWLTVSDCLQKGAYFM